jgi:prolyl-tRNA editing enzyme YbaK/EbsC (Cys-tRNA(Pro) deacylase)
VLDDSLLDRDVVYVAAGNPTIMLAIDINALLKLTNAKIAGVAS